MYLSRVILTLIPSWHHRETQEIREKTDNRVHRGRRSACHLLLLD